MRKYLILLAGGLGFEPRQAESESAVLPLDDPPKPGSRRAWSEASIVRQTDKSAAEPKIRRAESGAYNSSFPTAQGRAKAGAPSRVCLAIVAAPRSVSCACGRGRAWLRPTGGRRILFGRARRRARRQVHHDDMPGSHASAARGCITKCRYQVCFPTL